MEMENMLRENRNRVEEGINEMREGDMMEGQGMVGSKKTVEGEGILIKRGNGKKCRKKNRLNGFTTPSKLNKQEGER